MFQNHKAGYCIKAVTFTFPSTANGATADSGNILTQGDDQIERHVIGIISSDHSTGIQTTYSLGSKRLLAIDDSSFSPAAGPIDMDITVPQGLYIDVGIVNASGGALAPTVTVFYEVPRP